MICIDGTNNFYESFTKILEPIQYIILYNLYTPLVSLNSGGEGWRCIDFLMQIPMKGDFLHMKLVHRPVCIDCHQKDFDGHNIGYRRKCLMIVKVMFMCMNLFRANFTFCLSIEPFALCFTVNNHLNLTNFFPLDELLTFHILFFPKACIPLHVMTF